MTELMTVINDIKENLSQKSASHKDEVKVMQSMLNDKEYSATVYGSEGPVGTYCPAADARSMLTTVIADTTKINKTEAAALADAHQFSKAEAASMVGISKEFINCYMQTGRKLPLGGRETSNASLIGVDMAESTTRYPKKVGIGDDGKAIYENTEKIVPAHLKVKSSSPCPTWVK